MSSDLAPRLDSAYVEQTVGRLEARIRARFPDRRLGDAAHSLRTAVPQIHDGFEASKSRRRHIRWAARAASAVIVLVTLIALVLALRDPVLNGTDSSVDWLPIIESTVNDSSSGRSRSSSSGRCRSGWSGARCSTCCTGCARWPTWSTCTSSTRTPEQVRHDYHPTRSARPAGSWMPRSCTTTSTTAASWSRSSPRRRRCVRSGRPTRWCSHTVSDDAHLVPWRRT